ncbi:metal-dependent phosphohydrolase [Robbsia andropogonis]|uniref:metal-dependent phosphohydrolase n=1 Tax=Robbsia andropogonis TaxID=28092 RepID=UPI002A6A8194|nr:metal-dependent phosphohydrolase [Robbsia andropogonis]
MQPIILTASGAYFDLVAPKPEMIRITDIARALSRICRFTGHTSEFYSVAQHSVAVSHLVPKQYALQGLLHDASEAYLGDVSSPLKAILPEYKALERNVMAAITLRYGLPLDLHESVKKADLVMLAAEKRDLMFYDAGSDFWPCLYDVEPRTECIRPLGSDEAERAFLARFRELTGQAERNPAGYVLTGVCSFGGIR